MSTAERIEVIGVEASASARYISENIKNHDRVFLVAATAEDCMQLAAALEYFIDTEIETFEGKLITEELEKGAFDLFICLLFLVYFTVYRRTLSHVMTTDRKSVV